MKKHLPGLLNLKIVPPSEYAGGIPSIISSFRHIKEEMGYVRGFSTLMKMNQMTGFDCPGCAWPDPDDRRSVLAEYCENGVKAVAEEATLKRIDPEFFATHSVEEMASATDFWIGKQGRITHPMVLPEGASHYEPISWEAAFALIGDELKSLHSPDEAVFYTSGRTSNEAAFLYQLFVRAFGTNNLPDCSNMCHESSGYGLSQTVGIGKGSVTMEDIHKAEVVIVIGQNPGTNHPRMLTSLQKCKQNGGKIITVNPLPEAGLIRFKHPQHLSDMVGGGTSLTDIFLPVKINGDVALAKALMLVMFEAEDRQPGKVLDHSFIQTYTAGFEDFAENLRGYRLADLCETCGVSEADIRAAAELLIRHDKIVICWAMGLTQHKNGVDNVREMVNILLLKGAIGRPGAGTCPVRGHSNVQGDRTMGIWERPPQSFLDRLERRFGFAPPRQHGLNTVEAIQAMAEGRANVFFALGGNFLSATPDTKFTEQALRNCRLTVHVSTKLNRSHLTPGKKALILPCLGRTETDMQASGQQFVSVENSMGIVHSSTGELSPASPHLLSEPAIVAGLAKATLGESDPINWDDFVADYDRIRQLIEDCIPGFEDYNLRVRKPGGFYLPNGARERKFNTPDGKAHFSVTHLPDNHLPPGAYLMMTLRSHDQYNTTIYGLDDRYRGIYNERRVVLMNPADMEKAGFEAEELVNLVSEYDGEKRFARNFRIVPYDIPRTCIATYFPEANVLVPLSLKAEGSFTPASKSVVVRIENVDTSFA
ncbi:MAG: FdhF/YdeP family oxidoreductase [Bacteroidia bacterium]|nr:FdhF/YdeP family oxidoreductase [Bacteroidia bacterium]